MQIIKETIFTLWVKIMFKELMILQYIQYTQKKCIIETLQIRLSLHYNGNNSYLYVNSNQELKFKAKTDQLVKEKLCLGNLSDQWISSESEKAGLYGKIYDFVVDYEHVAETTKILDMHRYLIPNTVLFRNKKYTTKSSSLERIK